MASIQGVYLALFGRPADPLGLAFFNQATGNGSNLTAIGDLASTAEYQTRFQGQSTSQIITSIYQSLFNRDPDLSGLAFFANALATGALNINNIAIAIFDGAQGSDITTRDLKVAAADAFTAQIDTVTEINGYNGTQAASAGRAFISSVTDTAPTAEQVTAAVAVATTVTPGGASTTLTLGTDNLVGNSFSAPGEVSPLTGVNVATLTSVDKLSGTGANPTLTALLTGVASVAPTLSGIETVNLSSVTATSRFDFTNTTGLKTLNVDFSGTGAGQDFQADNIKALADVGLSSALPGSDALIRFSDAAVADAATSVNVKLSGFGVNTAAAGNLNVTGTTVGGVETLKVTAVGQNSFASIGSDSTAALGGAITAASATKTLIVDGDGSLRVNAAPLFNVTTVDASANKGGIRVGLDITKDVSVKGGEGADTFNFIGGLTNADTVDGGAGRDTLRVTGSTGLAAGNKITNTEILRADGGVAVTFDNKNVTSIDAFVQNATQTLTVTNAIGAAAADATKGLVITNTGNVDFGILDAGKLGNNSDAINIVVGQTTGSAATFDTSALQTVAGVNTGNLTLNNVEVVTIDVKADAAGQTSTGTGTITDAALTTLNIVGGAAGEAFAVNGGAGITATGLAKIDGSTFIGNLNISGNIGSQTISAGSGNDLIATGGRGAFADTVASDILTGGAGNDQFIFATSDAALIGADLTTAAASTGEGLSELTAIADLNLGGTAPTSTVDTINLSTVGGANLAATLGFNANTIVVVNGGTAQALTGANLGAAVNGAVNGGVLEGGAGVVSAGLFTFGGETYLIASEGTAAGDNFGAGLAGSDIIVRVTGVTGTLSVDDFSAL